MSDGQQGVIHGASEGGVTATHPDPDQFQLLVAPTTSDHFNTAHLRLIPVACWKVEDIRFAFDSSFVTPDIAKEIRDLSDLREQHKQADPTGGTAQYPPLSVFGHADPVGSDDYNKALSGRRATVIYALLISATDPDTAVRLWKQVAATENWGASQRQTMQAATNLPDGTSSSDLYKAYMATLCPKDLIVSKRDFLAQGADSAGKGDYQGCSEFNPLLIFSQQKEDGFDQDQDKTKRNKANAPNRRVMVLLFRIGSKVDATKWPCPRVTESKAGCIKRFWSDGQSRRSTRLPDGDRKFDDTQDTFACRFYQRISSMSPCEGLVPPGFVQLIIRLLDDDDNPRPGVPYTLNVSGAVFSRSTDSEGRLVHFVPPDSSQGTLTFDQHEVTLNIGALPPVEALAGLQIRLNNLGYDSGPAASAINDKIREAIRDFQGLHGLTVDGEPSSATTAKLKEVYGH